MCQLGFHQKKPTISNANDTQTFTFAHTCTGVPSGQHGHELLKALLLSPDTIPIYPSCECDPRFLK